MRLARRRRERPPRRWQGDRSSQARFEQPPAGKALRPLFRRLASPSTRASRWSGIEISSLARAESIPRISRFKAFRDTRGVARRGVARLGSRPHFAADGTICPPRDHSRVMALRALTCSSRSRRYERLPNGKPRGVEGERRPTGAGVSCWMTLLPSVQRAWISRFPPI